MFQSTRPVWGATVDVVRGRYRKGVSIHAPRVGRDVNLFQTIGLFVVSIHAPRVGRDFSYVHFEEESECFNPRAPCGARRAKSPGVLPSTLFQSTRPVWGATNPFDVTKREMQFQSTRPVWGATGCAGCHSPHLSVSIHAPRVGRDLS